jgi:hypothetical protein
MKHNYFLLRKGLLAPEKGAYAVILSEAKDLLAKASQQVEEIRLVQNDKSDSFFVAEGLKDPFPLQELNICSESGCLARFGE